jgi:hypothetical protein
MNEQYDNPWIFNNEPIFEPPEGAFGFVYEITNIISGRKYIGKKVFYNRVKKPPLKGKTRKRVSVKQSDWKTYYGSNKELNEDVINHGCVNFRRVMLQTCRSKGECSYYEAKLQFDNQVLDSYDYYNEWIMCKIHRKHIGVVKE